MIYSASEKEASLVLQQVEERTWQTEGESPSPSAKRSDAKSPPVSAQVGLHPACITRHSTSAPRFIFNLGE